MIYAQKKIKEARNGYPVSFGAGLIADSIL